MTDDRAPMSLNRRYDAITGKPLTPKVMEWIDQLSERYGEERVKGAMETVAATGKLERFLESVSKRLASAAAMARGGRTPTELDRETILAMVRRQIAEPERPYIWDAQALSAEEYTEVLAWTGDRQRGTILGVVEGVE